MPGAAIAIFADRRDRRIKSSISGMSDISKVNQSGWAILSHDFSKWRIAVIRWSLGTKSGECQIAKRSAVIGGENRLRSIRRDRQIKSPSVSPALDVESQYYDFPMFNRMMFTNKSKIYRYTFVFVFVFEAAIAVFFS